MDMGILDKLKGEIVVSSQAAPDEPLYREECMLAMMESVVNGGAGGLRVAGARDVKNAKKHFKIPVIGLTKPEKLPENWRSVVYITPSIKEINELIDAGADIIAFDATLRKRENPLEEMISAGDLRVGSTLFTEPERDYLNYMLNKSEFSDGLDLRNKYIHSTYPQDEEEQKKDYITLLKLMILVITKINDEFCTFYSQKDEP